MDMPKSSASSKVLTEREEIQRWAEDRGAKPACVRNTGDEEDIGMIRLDFPGYSGADSLQPIGWDEWFDKFEESNLALLVQEETADGEISNFNKLINRDNAKGSKSQSRSSSREQGRKKSAGGRSSSGKSGGSSKADHNRLAASGKTTSRVGQSTGRSSTHRQAQSKSKKDAA